MAVQAKHITLRIELPPVNGPAGPPSLVILHLDSLMYSGVLAWTFAQLKISRRCLCLLVSAPDFYIYLNP